MSYNSRSWSCVVVMTSLLVLAGCEDQEARNELNKTKSQIETLKSELETLKKEQKEYVDNIDKAKSAIEGKINTRMDEIAKGVSDLDGKLAKSLVDSEHKTNEAFNQQMSSIRDNYDKRFKEFVDPVLPSIQKVKDEVASTRAELLGYMDKQLKELYPYAFQPKRMDPATPPQAPQ